jgi:hypothetical protein
MDVKAESQFLRRSNARPDVSPRPPTGKGSSKASVPYLAHWIMRPIRFLRG